MDTEAFREAVETDARTELDRLGSNKLLLALTGAQLDEASVLSAAADAEASARDLFEAWADDEPNEEAREAFAAVAEREADHLERVREASPAAEDAENGEASDAAAEPTRSAMHSSLRDREGTVERVAAGMVGRPLVSLRTHTQLVSFFVNEADAARADLFRDLKTDVEECLETGLDLLADLCDDEDAAERARAAAAETVEAAYEDYETALSGMGMDPKPIC
ncbi:hypothetical protein [Haloparvum sedimenti]|uniref:hypothetical protein n=1 Tax=Haloparvum sedimenti TaxID=1678448 RepID=UPI00071E8F10|nr:hypothetical protein [Haloparvum sedimenti]